MRSELKPMIRVLKFFLAFLLCLTLFSCKKEEPEPPEPEKEETAEQTVPIEEETEIPPAEAEPEKQYILNSLDEGQILTYGSEEYYRYGPSIIKYEDGSYDMWVSSPGNSGSQWDWIRYRHSDDGIDWSEEEIVLQPTPGSKDQCSVCDPGVIYFNGYYYLGYTATDYYAGEGTYNMAFAARSKYPDGPFEKWNGNGWGGDPEPIIFYDGGKDYWGIGEISFVIFGEDLFIYYSYIDIRDTYIGLCKADLTDDWPATIRNKGPVIYRSNPDSFEVVYDSERETFFAFSFEDRMLESSYIALYESANGKEFSRVSTLKDNIEDYAHNLGISKSPEGWISSGKDLLAGYAYGQEWGRWNMKMQHIGYDYQ